MSEFKLPNSTSPVLLMIIALALPIPVMSAPTKTGHTCGCQRDSYSVYGAGQDSCATYIKEYEANPDSKEVDASFGQTLGWLAGYVSATNRDAKVRDVFNIELDYMANLIARWCRKHPDKVLSDAMDSLKDSKSGKPGFFPLD